MCKLCSTHKMGGNVSSSARKTEASNREPTSQDRLFSDDEVEKKFIADICWIKHDHWIRSEMKWNTIHGTPWKRMQDLGRGGYGSVCVGMRIPDKKLFAVKSINIDYPLTVDSRKRIRYQLSEIKMMRYLRSKYIVRCLGCGRSNDENGLNQMETLDVFLEYSIRGSLRSLYKKRHRKPFEEDPYIAQYTYDLLKALQYMQKKRVVHGDIKMANILLADDCVKLCDWGGAKQLKSNNLKRILIGTRGFRSPEVSNYQEQSYPADIFSLGCTMIEMATGKSPKVILTKVMGVDKFMRPIEIMEDQVQIPDKKLSPECKDFLEHCLCMNPDDRWTAAELLHHPFIINRDKTNKAPYALVAVPRSIGAKILRPPRRIHPELPNEPITKRVYRHLTGSKAPQSWVANLAGCAPTDPPLFPASPELRRPAPAPAPLPLVPEIHKKPHQKALQEFLEFITPPGRPIPSTDIPFYGAPYDSEELRVESPTGSSEGPTPTLNRGSDRIPDASSAALAKGTFGTPISPSISKGRSLSDVFEDVALDSMVPSKDHLLAQHKRNPVEGAVEFHHEILDSLNLMREVNSNLYDEAMLAAQQPLDDSSDDHALQLFPELMPLGHIDSADGNLDDVDESTERRSSSVIYRI